MARRFLQQSILDYRQTRIRQVNLDEFCYPQPLDRAILANLGKASSSTAILLLLLGGWAKQPTKVARGLDADAPLAVFAAKA
jgi:hypothetical protein